ncbi:myb-related protein 1-like isoform X2 [Typha angustifolia]|uniref:myb-related protein 1-like isoform X2 n=1 Tax=Typha angustifolia TaxID=59011 RepID=UPI003C2C442B
MYYHQQAHSNLPSSKSSFSSERCLFLQGGHDSGETGLVLSTDAKPRLKWTAELHEHFVEAVNQLGGADKATPKTVMRLMGIPGLTLYHLKSHLQKYRLSKNLQAQANTGTEKNVVGLPIATDSQSEGNGLLTSHSNIGPQTNNLQITEALQMQIEVQKKLHEQLEVQRHLQLWMEAQGKYLQSVLEKAEVTLGKQNLSSAGLEAAKLQLSEFVSKVAGECLYTVFPGFKDIPGLHTLQAHIPQTADGSPGSCLTSCEGSQKDQEVHNLSIGLTSYQDKSTCCNDNIGKDTRVEKESAWCEDFNKQQNFSSSNIRDQGMTEYPVHGNSGTLFSSLNTQRKNQDTGIASQVQQKEIYENLFLDQLNSKRAAKESDCSGLPSLKRQLDLNDENDGAHKCKKFDLNCFSWT